MTGTVEAPPRTGQVMVRAAHSAFQGTPGRLRVAGIATVTACLVFGVFAFIAAMSRADALSKAREDADQLVRVQSIRTNLVYADANLTNAFLVGGLEPATARAAYEQGIATASTTLADAAAHNADDADVLASVNEVIARYTGLVESARADNRLGYPLGAAYLRQATNLLRTDALPPLARLGQAQQSRISQAYSASADATVWLVVGLVVALLVLIATQAWLSIRTRRTFNLPLLAASAVVLVVGLVLAGAMVWSQSKAKSTRNAAYLATLELATARIDAFDAKSAESLTLIARGQGQAYDASFNNLSENVTAVLKDATARGGSAEEKIAQARFRDYLAVHGTIRSSDNAGRWDDAVRTATGQTNTVFQQFADASATALTQRSGQLRSDLGSARAPLPPLGWIALVAGVAAAVAAGLGVLIRLREYR
jgi:hypothetical protein